LIGGELAAIILEDGNKICCAVLSLWLTNFVGIIVGVWKRLY